jgi:hypothetical protein
MEDIGIFSDWDPNFWEIIFWVCIVSLVIITTLLVGIFIVLIKWRDRHPLKQQSPKLMAVSTLGNLFLCIFILL